MGEFKTILMSSTEQNLFNDAVAFYQAGQVGRALESYLSFLQHNPDHLGALNLGGVAAFETGDQETSKEMLRRAIELSPGFVEAHTNLAIVLQNTGSITDAVECHRKVTELAPDDPQAHFNLGTALALVKDFGEAIAALKRATALRPDFDAAWNNLGNVFSERALIQDAIDAYKHAVEINPGNVNALNNLGAVFLKNDQIHEALDAHQKALSIEPHLSETHNKIGRAYKEHGLIEKAADSFRQAIQCDPTNADNYDNLGRALKIIGNGAEAEKAFERAINIDPMFSEAHFNLGMLRYADTDPSAALESLNRAAEIHPEDELTNFFLGTLHAQSGNDEMAEAHFARLKRDSQGHNFYEDSWRYVVEKSIPTTRFFATTLDTLRYGLDEAHCDGLILEFGVRTGSTIRFIASLTDSIVHGFDTFEGLPESWGQHDPGVYTTKGELPDVPSNVELHVGLFSDTLPGFCEEQKDPIRYMNVDCDLCSSTVSIFEALGDRVRPGTVIVFDEYLMNNTWRNDEFKAFQEAVDEYGWRYEYLAFSLLTQQAVVRIL